MLAARQRSGLRYWASICHDPADEAWAHWLRRALRVYRVPKSLTGTQRAKGLFPRRLFPVFLAGHAPSPASPGDDPVARALRDSRYLIVICSPGAGVSAELDRQVRCFKALGRETQVLALVVPGGSGANPGSETGLLQCLPQAVRYRVGPDGETTGEPADPIVVDARHGLNARQRAFFLLVGGMLGATYEELRQCEFARAARRVQLMIASSAILAGVLVALGAQWHYQKVQAIQDQELSDMKQMLDDRARRRAAETNRVVSIETNQAPQSGTKRGD